MPDRAAPLVTAVYTGAFDPIHLGHVDIIRRAATIFSRLVVGVGVNPEKQHSFTIGERVDMVAELVRPFPNVEVRPFTGLAVHFVREVGSYAMIRGLRTVSDMEYEFSMSLTNQTLDPNIQTLFMLPRVEFSHLSSTLIRQIAALGGDLAAFLPGSIIPRVLAKTKVWKEEQLRLHRAFDGEKDA
jgi:pantetheine-phosphate adenylyltransferase